MATKFFLKNILLFLSKLFTTAQELNINSFCSNYWRIKMAINDYSLFVGGDGSIDIPEGIALDERLELLYVGAGEALKGYNGKAFKQIQKRIKTTELAIEIERMEKENTNKLKQLQEI